MGIKKKTGFDSFIQRNRSKLVKYHPGGYPRTKKQAYPGIRPEIGARKGELAQPKQGWGYVLHSKKKGKYRGMATVFT